MFVGKSSAKAYLLGRKALVNYGPQSWQISGTPVFLVPSTSGRSLKHCPYRERLEWFRALRRTINSYWEFAPV